ncbi:MULTISPECIES: tail fiber domain-containing protein [Pseudomonas syringae group genomosp. 2]|uniref:tail fiber domain-containing protein n=1 Tax=Pseudomonas savastanoi TaxID=29438 RepID=UPI00073A51D9|nr:tail fiber domain-containing protein [Pseudomonas savastanoi]KUG41045.1 Tail fiber domain-containing protein [Pseudomonas savastanoi pv. fraxini]KWS62686.1 peptidase S74 [Pseudomonas savastanoi pv. fraxini]PAB24529.1 peptidase S74 [Pseudomonas savastanoi]PAB25542.1 peptidase S74 [Pseudomonas savastanoi pv. fraxini]RMR63857.1 Tail fiber domain-containing protein [Pseudomonas savastanoi pv. fraxini]
MPWYKAGTVSVTQNSNAVIGSGTAFIANSRVGDGFRGPDGGWYEVTNIASDTAMSIAPNYQGASNSAGGYALAPLQGYVKESADALRALVNKFGTQLAALGTTGNYDTLPVAKGGTGRSDGRVIFSEVGVQQASALYNVQGMYMGWNSNSQGEGHFVVNRGGGAGGFTWRSVNAGNTATGPAMTYSYEGLLTVSSLSVTAAPISIASGGTGGNSQTTARNSLGIGPASAPTFAGLELSNNAPYIDFHYNNTTADYDVRLINQAGGVLTLQGAMQITGRLESAGTWCRAGLSAGRGGTVYNYNWTGSNVDVWIDNTYVGTMTLFGSDYRFKKYIADAKVPSYRDRINAYRIVTYQRKVFGAVFRGDGTTYQGLIAHEAQAVNPLAVTGEKDGVDENGNARIQQLDPMALITDLMGAVKELHSESVELRAELAALKASIQPAPEPAAA